MGLGKARLFYYHYLGRSICKMKRCPHCGTDLVDGTISFCPKCRKKLTNEKSAKGKYARNRKKKSAKKKEKTSKKKPVKKKETKIPEVMGEPVDDGYDGYYNDVLPPDKDRISEGLDKELVKNIVVLGIGFTVIVGLCVALLYVL